MQRDFSYYYICLFFYVVEIIFCKENCNYLKKCNDFFKNSGKMKSFYRVNSFFINIVLIVPQY